MLKRYPIRVLKYFLFLVALFIVLFGLMVLFHWSSWNTFLSVWQTDRLWVLLFVFVGIPLLYPLFSYTARDVRGNLGDRREIVERVLTMSGYTLTEATPEKIIAHAKGIKKVALLFEDRIEITPEGNHFIRIEGTKKEVLKIESRLRALGGL
ncbi:MAG: hypothetical protein LBM20_06425 [Rikenellaceae bacterium]|jgi:hypothetical protein|nr:hypothetical protein [Rikenellaceae bacterium]